MFVILLGTLRVSKRERVRERVLGKRENTKKANRKRDTFLILYLVYE